MAWTEKWWHIPDDFFSLFFPRLCLACGKNIRTSDELICLFCSYKLPKTHFHKYPENPVTRHFWGRAKVHHGAAFFYYVKGGRVQQLIHKLKYGRRPEIGEKLGQLYGIDLKDCEWMKGINLLIPVPLHPWKLKKRGFNQSLAFAKGLEEILEIPVYHGLKRTEMGGSQTNRSRIERFRNVEQAFHVSSSERIKGLHLLLVDDVITTGATLEACAIKLMEVPGVVVSVLTLAFAGK